MAEATTIIRRATTEEKRDYVEIKGKGNTSILNAFLKALSKKQQKYTKLHRPFDGYCARMDFEDRVKKIAGDIRSSLDVEKVESKIPIGDLDRYSNPERYKYLGKEDVKEDKLLDGIRQSSVTGRKYKFKCKFRGDGLTIFVSSPEVDEMEEFIDKSYKKKPKVESEEEVEEEIPKIVVKKKSKKK